LAMSIYVRAFAVLPEPVGKEPGTKEPATPKSDKLGPPPVAAQMRSDQIYRAYCMACHNADGSGESVRKAMPEIPAFADPKWQARPDAEIKKSILEGKGKFMLPMKDKLSPADADQMVAYLRGFREGKLVVPEESHQPLVPSPVQPAVVTTPKVPKGVDPPLTTPSPDIAERIRAGATLYRQSCLTCHGNDGRGTQMRASMPTIPDFANGAWQRQVTTPQMVVSILDGKGTFMPSSRGRISTDQAQDLAAFVRAFGPAQTATQEIPATDFETRFKELENQWKELERQLNELPKPPPKR
jgi:mono/diheme cytochrome c family protein